VGSHHASRTGAEYLVAPGEQKEIAHYVTTQTGGQYLDATPATYAGALEEILRQLHFRYELGFEPKALDGNRHKLVVTLVDSVRKDLTTASAQDPAQLLSRPSSLPPLIPPRLGSLFLG